MSERDGLGLAGRKREGDGSAHSPEGETSEKKTQSSWLGARGRPVLSQV